MLNEWDVISTAWNILRRDSRELLGFDDAAAIRLGDTYLIVNIDAVEARSNWLPGLTAYDIGWRAVVSSISDIVVKGGRPIGIMLYTGITPSVSSDFIEELYRGIADAAAAYGAGVWGGDVGALSSEFVLGVVALGLAERLVSRGGAKPGDVVLTTGSYGATAVAYAYALGGLGGEIAKRLYELCRRPMPRLLEYRKLVSLANAAIDSSDGLALTLHQLAGASGVRIVVENVPLTEGVEDFCAENGLDPVELALYGGGEEFEAVFSVDRGKVDDVTELAKKLGVSVSIIGYVEEGSGVYLKRGGQLSPIEARGWVKMLGWSHAKGNYSRRLYR